jgi:uncharacterized membrane protein
MSMAHIIVLGLMLATVAVLIAGVLLMAKGGALNKKYGNKMMVARVGLQALTLALVGALFLLGK